jgi:hypothetical protein
VKVHSNEFVMSLFFFEPSTSARGIVVIIVMNQLYGLFAYSYDSLLYLL